MADKNATGTTETTTKRAYNRKPRMGKEQVGDTIQFTDESNVIREGTLVDVSEGQKLVDGQRAATRKMLVQFPNPTDAKPDGVSMAVIEQTCVAPDGSKIDWSSIYCTQINYSAAK